MIDVARPWQAHSHCGRCKDNAIGLQGTSGNGLIIRPRIGSTPVHKEKVTLQIS